VVMQRIVVGGISGCGKSRLARELARRLDLPYVDFDALFHGPAWSVRDEFLADVDAFVVRDRWVTDSDGYGDQVGSRVRDRADTYVWLDYDRRLVMWRVIRRTAWRAATRQRLFNDNRERPFAAFTDSDHPVRWAWRRHAERRARNAALIADGSWAHARVVRLRNPRETAEWLRNIRESA
jgi:adenylate kinase family enzyme